MKSDEPARMDVQVVVPEEFLRWARPVRIVFALFGAALLCILVLVWLRKRKRRQHAE